MHRNPFDLNSLSPPNLKKLYQQLDDFGNNYPEIVEIHSLGLSDEGREIKAFHVTDRGRRSLAEKEVVVVICGRHGDELGAFAVGLQLLHWLVSEEASDIIKDQLLIIVPFANPDGFVRGEFFAPKDKLSGIEKNYIKLLVDKFRPDVLIDVHSIGRGDLEAVIAGHTSHTGEDDFISGLLGTRMIKGAELEGYPFILHLLGVQQLKPWTNVQYNNFICQECFELCHSLVFGLEVNHYSLDIDDAAQSGVAAIKPLLNAANKRFPWEYYSGYPNRIIKGNFLTSIRATGNRPGDRRESRYEIWNNRDSFTEPIRKIPDRRTIKIKTDYSGEILLHPISFCCRIRGRPNIRQVYLDDSETKFYTCEDDCSLYVFSDALSLNRGEHEVEIKLE